MLKYVFVSFLFLAWASRSTAQVPTSGNIFFGYSFQNASASAFQNPLSNLSRPNMNGWRATLEGKIFPHVGIVADFTGEYGSQSYTELPPVGGLGGGPVTVNVSGHEFDVVFGPRVTIPVGKFTPFGEAMAGVSHISVKDPNSGPSDTSLATVLGGGLDYRLLRLVAWRFEGDYVVTRFFGTHQDNFRFSTGIVVHF